MLNGYIESKSDYWAIVDSFAVAVDGGRSHKKKKNLLSDTLVEVIQDNAAIITQNWLKDITTNRSTPSYQSFDKEKLFERAHGVLSQFSKWASEYYLDKNAPGILDVDSALPKPNVGEEYLWGKTAGIGIVPKWVSFIGLLAIPLLIIGIIVLIGVFVL